MDPIIASALISGAAMVGSSVLGKKTIQAEAPGLQSKPVMIQSPYQSGLPYKSIGLPQMIGGGLSNRLMPSNVGSLPSRGK